MIKFSIIVPVYNRPDEVEELLKSLVEQSEQNFEVIIVEDGSELPSREVVGKFDALLEVFYLFKPNSGPGLSRNFGVERAHGNYFVFVDSDCILPPQYISELNKAMAKEEIKCFGGPDKAHESFTPVQKAISYSMTSFFTTGGIRGGSRKVIKFHPRSFNMGFSPEVYKITHGYAPIRFGEDIDLSLRIEDAGFRCVLIEEAYVYHKRRTDFNKFYKQIFNSGIARINLFRRHPQSLKLTHFFPAAFVLASIMAVGVFIFYRIPFFLFCFAVYLFLIFADASLKSKSMYIGVLALVATCVQMFAYGLGFIKAFIKRIILGKKEFSAFERNFYK
jgi:glycosyltransferase involved in cell wall biosynthesis